MNPSQQAGFSVGAFVFLVAFAAAFSVVTILAADRAAIQRARTMLVEVQPLRQDIEQYLKTGKDPQQAIRDFRPTGRRLALVDAVAPDGTIRMQDLSDRRSSHQGISMSLRPRYDPAGGRINWACDGIPREPVQLACNEEAVPAPH